MIHGMRSAFYNRAKGENGITRFMERLVERCSPLGDSPTASPKNVPSSTKEVLVNRRCRMFRLLIASAVLLSLVQAGAAQSLAPASARVPAKGPAEDVTLPTVKPSVVGGPQKFIYRVSGLRDTGGQVTPDVASFVSCTSFSNVSEDLHIIATGYAGTRFADVTVGVAARHTVTFVTHPVTLFSAVNLNTGVISQGSASLLSTTTNILCTAGIVNTATYAVDGIALHMQRFNPYPGAVE
jgi:hypothetical protein